MNLDLSPTQQSIREKAKVFAAEYIASVAERNDRDEIFPRDILNASALTGLMTPSQIQKLIIGRHLTWENAFS